MRPALVLHEAALVPLDELKPHPQNYRAHPDDQRAHLVRSITEHGVYRNVLVARDGTILAGHGVVEAARDAGLTEVPVVRLELDADDPRALKILTGDNEIARLAGIDDRLLSELLRTIRDSDPVDGLLGTGYDDDMLAALVFVTRDEREIGDRDDAAQWIGLPVFDGIERPHVVMVGCETIEERDALLVLLGVTTIHRKIRGTISVRWPPTEREDLAALRFEVTE